MFNDATVRIHYWWIITMSYVISVFIHIQSMKRQSISSLMTKLNSIKFEISLFHTQNSLNATTDKLNKITENAMSH